MGTVGLLPKWVGQIVAAIGDALAGLGDVFGLAVALAILGLWTLAG